MTEQARSGDSREVVEVVEDVEAVEAGRAILRDLIQHEDQLRDQRLGYLLTLNGLLFAALGFAWTSQTAGPLLGVIAAMGIGIAVVGLSSMILSDWAIRYWRKLADRGLTPAQIPVSYSRTEVVRKEKKEKKEAAERAAQGKEQLERGEPPDTENPEKKKERHPLRWILGAWHAVPIILFFAWAAILWIVHNHRHW
jgi:hypothetical protein